MLQMKIGETPVTVPLAATFAISGWRAKRSADTSIAAASASMPVLSARMA